MVLQALGDGDHAVRPGDRPENEAAGNGIGREQGDVRPPSRQDHGDPKPAAEPDRGNVFGIEVVGVDEVKGFRPQQPPKKRRRTGLQQGRSQVGADLRDYGIARMQDRDAVTGFFAWHPGKRPVAAEARATKGKPEHRSHHARGHLATRQQMTLAVLDEHRPPWHRGVGVERGEGQQPYRRTAHGGWRGPEGDGWSMGETIVR